MGSFFKNDKLYTGRVEAELTGSIVEREKTVNLTVLAGAYTFIETQRDISKLVNFSFGVMPDNNHNFDIFYQNKDLTDDKNLLTTVLAQTQKTVTNKIEPSTDGLAYAIQNNDTTDHTYDFYYYGYVR